MTGNGRRGARERAGLEASFAYSGMELRWKLSERWLLDDGYAAAAAAARTIAGRLHRAYLAEVDDPEPAA